MLGESNGLNPATKFCPSTYSPRFCMPYFIHSSLTQHVKQKGIAKWNDVEHWSLGGYPEMPRVHGTESWLGWCWSIVGQGLMRPLTATKKVTAKKPNKPLFPNLEHRVSLKLRLSEGRQGGTVGHGACCESLETWVQSLELIKSRNRKDHFLNVVLWRPCALVHMSTYSIQPLLISCFLTL